jgi:hypothetical protein
MISNVPRVEDIVGLNVLKLLVLFIKYH